MANLLFHRRTGNMVTLSNSNKSAQRNHPHQEFNNGLVMSSEPLNDDQIFEVRIDKKVPTWSGSVEIGITCLDPSTLEFPSSATNLREGSWVMSGTSILQDGRSIVEEYGEDLDQLAEGDRVGVMRTTNGDLHFFVNGVDQGVAASGITSAVYAVIDMYGKCAQVSVVDSMESRMIAKNISNENIATGFTSLNFEDGLKFHERCGTMVKLSNGNRTAERKRPVDEFNNGVVMTHRPLKENEMFEIRIDELVNKWSGSIEMGITTHNPETLEFPATMTNMRSGTIMMSGCGILTNGKGSRREYGEFNLDELHEGDRIGLIKKSNGNLHYYINGLDQGIAANAVPSVVYGVVDLYGMTVKVTITDLSSPGSLADVESQTSSSLVDSQRKNSDPQNEDTDKLLFHLRCGLHVTVINGGQTAFRPNSLDDFNNAVVLTNRPLHQGELFQVLLEQVVMKWAGSIEIGVTTHSPHELEFPSTMTNVRSGTWMMTGNGIMYNGTTIIDEYGHNLDKLKAGDRVGVRRSEQGKLHFYVNGINQGLAASNVPDGVYGVIDLYGQAARASIVYQTGTSNALHEEADYSVAEVENDVLCLSNGSTAVFDGKTAYLGKCEVDHINANSRAGITRYPDGTLHYYRNSDDQCPSNGISSESSQLLSSVCGRNIVMKNSGNTAARVRSFNHGLVFSAKPLENEELFEVQIDRVNPQWAGSLILGLTSYSAVNQMTIPASAVDLTGCDSWIYVGSQIRRNGQVLKENYAPSLFRLSVGDRVGVQKFADGNLHFVLNGIDLGVAAMNLPKKLYVVADIHGYVEGIRVFQTTTSQLTLSPLKNAENGETLEGSPSLETGVISQGFHENHGRNIQLTNGNLTAHRVASYNQGLVMSCKNLQHDELFQVRIDNLHVRWTSSLQIGVTNQCPDKLHLPISALSMRRGTWIICGDSVYQNGIKIRARYGPNLDSLQSSHLVGIKIDSEGRLHLYVNGIDQGIAAEGIPLPCYGIIDLYGQCEQVTIAQEEYCTENEAEKDNREKADIDNGIKEKILKPVSIDYQPVRNCEYQNTCARFKAMLGLPDGFFLPDQNICYCETCHKLRNDEPYFKKGEPPRDYALPFGWCRFGLRLRSKAENGSVQEKWHVAFHGTTVGAVRQILDSGQLLPPEKLGLALYSKDAARKGNAKDADSCEVFLSPTLRYAGCSKFSPKHEFVDPKTKSVLHCRVAFQVFVRPGSYRVSPQRLGTGDPVDTHFSNNDIEWYTKEQGSTVLHCLLIRIEGL